ncbi:MAG TPA: hypothetical protein VFD58_23645 [Blastocatellia bacterium]|nr:hypothetical protein [Blastocatellia bacterium]
MKKLLMATGFLCAAMIGLSASATAPANFAGTWVLDKGKSELPQQMAANVESITWMITQDDKELTIKPDVKAGGGGGGGRPGMMNQPQTYKLDGSETTSDVNFGQASGKATRKAKWTNDGKNLELNTVTNLDFNGNAVTITSIQHLELAEGGKVLKAHSTTESPRGTQESKMVFNKQ